jgi:hypothetical protein
LVELPLVREEFGFCRTTCACPSCQVHCRHLPGSLAPADISRLCPTGQDEFAWAEHHLRALADTPFPTLVPARQANGHCHWLFAGRCAVHDSAPYGCAFFDSHMAGSEVKSRLAATLRARREDAEASGLYYTIWRHLRQKGLVSRGGDRSALRSELAKIKRNAQRNLRRRREQSTISEW